MRNAAHLEVVQLQAEGAALWRRRGRRRAAVPAVGRAGGPLDALHAPLPFQLQDCCLQLSLQLLEPLKLPHQLLLSHLWAAAGTGPHA